ncbi:MAG: cation diffusion facilitator family transporter [Patescibacteria group bacterium]|nr:cation diffusion facilitator family transporter [Patescibacteria group bacterium]
MQTKITTKRVLFISFFVDILDVVTNIIVAVITGSAVIFAEMVQGVTDTLGSYLLIIGYRRSNKPKDPSHPFGYTREVFFWSLLSSMVMLFLGSGLSLWRGYSQTRAPEIIHGKWLALGILFFSVITNSYSLMQSVKKLHIPGTNLIHVFKVSGKQLVKTTLIKDLLGTLSALIGLAAIAMYDLTGILFFDGLGAIFIGILMVVFALILTYQTRNLIAGMAVPKAIIVKIRESVTKIPEVIAINHLAAIYTGTEKVLVDLDLDISKNLNTTQIENVLDHVKKAVTSDIPEVQSVQIDLNSPLVKEEVIIEKTPENILPGQMK